MNIFFSIFSCIFLIWTLLDYASDADLTLLRAIHQHAPTEVIEELVPRCAAYVNVADKRGYTPLMWAAEWGYEKLVQRLVQHGADIHTIDPHGWDACMWAAFNGQGAIVRRLVAAGSDVNRIDHGKNSLLELALRNGHQDIASFLVSQGAHLSSIDPSFLLPVDDIRPDSYELIRLVRHDDMNGFTHMIPSDHEQSIIKLVRDRFGSSLQLACAYAIDKGQCVMVDKLMPYVHLTSPISRVLHSATLQALIDGILACNHMTLTQKRPYEEIRHIIRRHLLLSRSHD